jgi:hypothetical protein
MDATFPPMSSEESVEFLSQGRLAVDEAERILPRLEKEKIRFQIETFLPKPRSTKFGPIDRFELYIHPDDVEAWRRIRNEFFPV